MNIKLNKLFISFMFIILLSTTVLAETLQTNVCPQEITGSLILYIVGFIGMLFMFLGINNNKIYGMMGSFILMMLSFILVGCVATIGYILALISGMFIIWFGLREQ